jgi:putative SOS response-associated peptidase YedK
MCFYYAITKKNAKLLVDKGIIKEKQLELFTDHFLVNGFEHPAMPVITDKNPDEISLFRWGFVPSTVKSEAGAAEILKRYNTLNAHSDRISESKLYGEAVRNNRCLVLCSGFFEWRKVKGKKVPYYISLKDDSLFAFAGIWSDWIDELGEQHGTYAILTVEANELLAQVHNIKKRMPLILPPDQAKQWLNLDLSAEEIKDILKPIASESLKAHTVNQFLSIPQNERKKPEIIAYYNYPGVDEIVLDKLKRNEEDNASQLMLDL